MELDNTNMSFEKLSLETQRLIKGLEILKQKLDKISELETTVNNKWEDQAFTSIFAFATFWKNLNWFNPKSYCWRGYPTFGNFLWEIQNQFNS